MNRCSESERSVLFVDLDGTLVLENSFHVFIAELWAGGGLRARIALLMALLRRSTSTSGGRVRMKHAIMATFERLDHARCNHVVEAVICDLQNNLSLPVCEAVQSWRDSGASIVLATAAPDAYASKLASELGFDDCLATPPTSASNWHEMIGARKAAKCREWTKSNHCTGQIGAISDHPDDLPLMAIAENVTIQSDPNRFKEISSQLDSRIAIAHIDTFGAQHEGGAWLWFDGSASGPHDKWEVLTILSKHRYALVFSETGEWVRVGPGRPTVAAQPRVDRPMSPGYKNRMRIALQRKLVRDRLGIFH